MSNAILFTSAYCLQLLFYIMVFSNKDSVLIEQLHRSKGYGAKKFKEFPEKKRCCVPKIIGIG